MSTQQLISIQEKEINQEEVLYTMVDALWLYVRSLKATSNKDPQLIKEIEKLDSTLYAVLTVLHERMY
jgi:predicted neuraminidase